MSYNIYVEKYDGKKGYFGWFEGSGFCFGYSKTDCYLFMSRSEAEEAARRLNNMISVKRADIVEH